MFDSGIIDLLYIMYTGGMFKRLLLRKERGLINGQSLRGSPLSAFLSYIGNIYLILASSAKHHLFAKLQQKKFIQSIHSSQGIVCLQNVAKNCTKISPPYLLIGHDALVVDPKCKI